MSSAKGSISSEALEANLSLTRAEVVIPNQDRVLLEAVERYYRVHEVARITLEEYHHPFRNVDDVIEGLRTLCGGMLHYYEVSEAAEACADRLQALFEGLYAPDLGDDTAEHLVETHLTLLCNLAAAGDPRRFAHVLERGISSLVREVDLHELPFVLHAGGVRRLAQSLSWDERLARAAASAYAQLARSALERWRRFLREPARRERLGLDRGGSIPAVEHLSARLVELEKALGTLSDPVQALSLETPDDLVTHLIGELDSKEGGTASLGTLRLLVELLPLPHLRRHRSEILRQLYFTLRAVCAEGETSAVAHAVDLIPSLLRKADARARPWLYRGLELLGRELARRGESELVEHFMDRLVADGFEPPDVGRGTETWDVEVNPNHLICLKTWMAIIASDPHRYERLLSALAVHIHFRGVFVKDTDLLQRDVSALLGAGLGSAFNLTLQLARHLPVFFNDLGSEGELRDVSTRIDQIARRRDPVVHYLRKQSHAESNSRLVSFTAALARAWASGDPSALAPFLPPSLMERVTPEDPWFGGAHRAMEHLARQGLGPEALAEAPLETLAAALEAIPPEDGIHRERILLLSRMWRLLRAKYEYDPEQILPAVRGCPRLDPAVREAFAQACRGGDPLQIVRAGNAVLEALRLVATDPSPTAPDERIYHKRHIAVGIPSVYGSYHEPRFDALGLMLRLMRFLKPHLERCVADFPTGFTTRYSLARAHELMQELLRGLRACGLRVRDLAQQISLLDEAASLPAPTVRQYLDVLGLVSEALVRTVEVNFIAPHEANLRIVLERVVEDRRIPPAHRAGASGSLSEEFLRSAVASTYALQELDTLTGRLRDSLTSMAENLGEAVCARVLAYRPDHLIVHLGEEEPSGAPALQLGAKGAGLNRLHGLGFPVPEGFVITTRLFRVLPALEHAGLAEDTRSRILAAVERLERETGLALGDPAAPLLVSIRSGAAFSMPGMLNTILNVGLCGALAEEISRRDGPAWTMWDCWRRSIQNVAMAQGVERDVFDGIMVDFKRRAGVTRKVEFSAAQMREMAYAYREEAVARGAEILEDPRDQVMQAVHLVLLSWDSDTARVYRRRLGLSDDWGTAVIVQRMVFGNLSSESGSGVVFTRDPWASGTGVNLYGDFTLCSQGEDVVAGLVHPLPVSEEQRLSRRIGEGSLESLFPGIYRRLLRIASQLVGDLGFEHQEIEFTFESADPDSLHLLQTRPLRLLRQERTTVFADSPALASSLAGRGTGVSGGALTGRVVFGKDDLEAVRSAHPGDHLILVRPDTVPEDIPLVLEADGLLTARGGATSHAAITAKRLGTVCVVNCLDLEVDDAALIARIGGRVVRSGEEIGIDGLLGNVYVGRHEVVHAGAGGLRIEGGLA